MNGKKSYVKPEELIVNELIRALEDGVPVWRKEWSCKGGFRNLLTGKNYQGSNPALLCISSAVRGWHLPLFIGGGQAKSIGCLPKKGSKSARIMQPLQRSFELKDKDENGEVQFGSYMSYKCVPVFNVADVRGIDEESEKKLQELIDKAVLTSAPRPLDERVKQAHDRLFQWEHQVKAVIKGGDRAYYRPTTDEIVIPKRYNFKNDESYLATFAHECIHSTMKRLDRKDLTYAQEELVAELGAYLICSRLEISNLDTKNHAAYLAAWSPMLKSDPKILFKSLANASKAADMVIGEQ
ncbi:MAG: zincin-like metallopeptidase domain-containing protein [Prochlorococcus sp. ALOHA_A2.0_50]|nr:zincin-like metallopeptidase domain-containing protein [Prochlorococcus sp. ALOHA_A2.0_50]